MRVMWPIEKNIYCISDVLTKCNRHCHKRLILANKENHVYHCLMVFGQEQAMVLDKNLINIAQEFSTFVVFFSKKGSQNDVIN